MGAFANVTVGNGNAAPATFLVTGGGTVSMRGLNIGQSGNDGGAPGFGGGDQVIVRNGTLEYLDLQVYIGGNSTGSAGAGGVGTMIINGSNAVVRSDGRTNDNLSVGNGDHSVGALYLMDGSLGAPGGTLSSPGDVIDYFRVGNSGGKGVVYQSGGLANIGRFILGYGNSINFPTSDGSAYYELSGGTLMVTNSFGICFYNDATAGWGTNTRVARTENATLTIKGTGFCDTNQNVGVGYTPNTINGVNGDGGTGTLNIQGGEMRIENSGMMIAVNPDARGIVNFSGGSLTVNGTIKVGSLIRTSAQFNFTGGTLQTYLSNTMTLDATLGTVTQDATSNNSMLNIASGNVNSNANYTAAVSSGSNTATVFVAGGSKLTMASTSTLTIGNQAFLEGSGTVTGGSVALNAGSTLIPSPAAPGTFTIKSALSINNGAALDYVLGNLSDLVDQVTNLSLGASRALNVTQGSGFSPYVTYPLIHYTGTDPGNFDSGWTISGAGTYTSTFTLDGTAGNKFLDVTFFGTPNNAIWISSSSDSWGVAGELEHQRGSELDRRFGHIRRAAARRNDFGEPRRRPHREYADLQQHRRRPL